MSITNPTHFNTREGAGIWTQGCSSFRCLLNRSLILAFNASVPYAFLSRICLRSAYMRRAPCLLPPSSHLHSTSLHLVGHQLRQGSATTSSLPIADVYGGGEVGLPNFERDCPTRELININNQQLCIGREGEYSRVGVIHPHSTHLTSPQTPPTGEGRNRELVGSSNKGHWLLMNSNG